MDGDTANGILDDLSRLQQALEQAEDEKRRLKASLEDFTQQIHEL